MVQVWVMLLTYNEAGNIRLVVDQILSQPLDIGVVIVDDNSPSPLKVARWESLS